MRAMKKFFAGCISGVSNIKAVKVKQFSHRAEGLLSETAAIKYIKNQNIFKSIRCLNKREYACAAIRSDYKFFILIITAS